jgi:hypothetical protein
MLQKVLKRPASLPPFGGRRRRFSEGVFSSARRYEAANNDQILAERQKSFGEIDYKNAIFLKKIQKPRECTTWVCIY